MKMKAFVVWLILLQSNSILYFYDILVTDYFDHVLKYCNFDPYHNHLHIHHFRCHIHHHHLLHCHFLDLLHHSYHPIHPHDDIVVCYHLVYHVYLVHVLYIHHNHDLFYLYLYLYLFLCHDRDRDHDDLCCLSRQFEDLSVCHDRIVQLIYQIYHVSIESCLSYHQFLAHLFLIPHFLSLLL